MILQMGGTRHQTVEDVPTDSGALYLIFEGIR